MIQGKQPRQHGKIAHNRKANEGYYIKKDAIFPKDGIFGTNFYHIFLGDKQQKPRSLKVRGL